jgi:hypothetical protein
MSTSPSPARQKFRLGALCGLGAAAIAAGAILSYAADDTSVKATDLNHISQAPPEGWHVHDRKRPQPPVITPPTASTQEQPGQPPSDAVVLFDGKSLDSWLGGKDGKQPAPWKVENGYFEIVPKTGQLVSKESFGDCQFHAEFRMPDPPRGKDQDRGNSGIFLMGRYEAQVLDNYQAETYADGMVGAVYGQYPPQVNAARKPGEWQTYDIVFHAPRFNEDGTVAKPARETTFLNGVLVQDNVELKGGTGHMALAKYQKHADKAPITIQDHGHPVRFRNLWIRPIAAEAPIAPTMPGEKH